MRGHHRTALAWAPPVTASEKPRMKSTPPRTKIAASTSINMPKYTMTKCAHAGRTGEDSLGSTSVLKRWASRSSPASSLSSLSPVPPVSSSVELRAEPGNTCISRLVAVDSKPEALGARPGELPRKNFCHGCALHLFALSKACSHVSGLKTGLASRPKRARRSTSTSSMTSAPMQARKAQPRVASASAKWPNAFRAATMAMAARKRTYPMGNFMS
mmetsp:Transcript_38943/g.112473  ORF Transcript_38943/g.112473 Transcript_38943/m.112473 type:complete len:215 (-) Transcript_38943:778-1422(-)